MRVGIGIALASPASGVQVTLTLLSQDGSPILETSSLDGDLARIDGGASQHFTVTIPENLLIPGEYHLGLTLRDAAEVLLARVEPAVSFTLLPGERARAERYLPRRGHLDIPCRWERRDGRVPTGRLDA